MERQNSFGKVLDPTTTSVEHRACPLASMALSYIFYKMGIITLIQKPVLKNEMCMLNAYMRVWHVIGSY